MTDSPHPGTIEFIDGDTGEVVDRAKVADLPPSMCFEKDEHGTRIPVVKIVAHTTADRRTILAYGPKGELLRTTTQLA
jgi:hypothetical protein